MSIDLGRREIRVGDTVQRLTDKEAELLAYLASHADRIVGREELLEQVWGYHPDSQSRAIDKTLTRLRAKLEGDPEGPKCIVTVRGEGFRFALPELPAAAVIAPTRFYGRTQESQTVSNALQDGVRLTTIVGPGGIGKTRLAHEIAAATEGWSAVVSLADATSPEDCLRAVGAALGVRGGPLQDAIRWALQARGRGLLVLDNLEHVLDAISPPLREWLIESPELSVLATSREPVGVPGERVVPLGRLGPDPASAMLRDRSGWMDEESTRALAEALEGIPLALELVAGMAPMLTPAQVLERLPEVLSHARLRAVPSRHETLSAAISWSWETTDPVYQQALAQCTVFRGPFDLEAATEVLQTPDALGAVLSLARRSMLRVEGSRFALFEVIRGFASQYLAPEVAGATRSRHFEYTVKATEHGLRSTSSQGIGEAIRAKLAIADFEAAWQFGYDEAIPNTHALAQAFGYLPFHASEVRDRVERTLERCPAEHAAVLRSQLALARALQLLGDAPRAAEIIERVLEEAVLHRDIDLEREVCHTAALRALPGRDRLVDARRCLALAVEGPEHLLARAYTTLGAVLRDLEEVDDSREAFRSSAEAYRRCDDRDGEALAVCGLSTFSTSKAEIQEAIGLLEQHRERAISTRARVHITMLLALMELRVGLADAAVRHSKWAAEHYARNGDRFNEIAARANAALAHLDGGKLDEGRRELQRCLADSEPFSAAMRATLQVELAAAHIMAGDLETAGPLLSIDGDWKKADVLGGWLALHSALRRDPAGAGAAVELMSSPGFRELGQALVAVAAGDQAAADALFDSQAVHELLKVHHMARCMMKAMRRWGQV